MSQKPFAWTFRRKRYVEEYVKDFHQTAAAIRAGYSSRGASVTASRLMKEPEVQAAIAQRLDELSLSREEVLIRLAAHARGDLGKFLKVGEIWVAHPLESHEPVLDEAGEWLTTTRCDSRGREYTVYRVRVVVVDTAKLLDPQHSHLVKRFSDSPKSGLSIELYDAQSALVQLGKGHRLFSDESRNLNVDLSTLSDEQLERLSNGEDLLVVLNTASQGGTGDTAPEGDGTEPVDAVAGPTDGSLPQ